MPKNEITFSHNLLKKAHELGFSNIGVSDIDLTTASTHFKDWLNKGFHGDMHYMAAHGEMRHHPELLVEGTISVLTAKISYFNPNLNPKETLNIPTQAAIAQYALGRDYHKLIRKRLDTLALWIKDIYPNLAFRSFSDSAPVLERALNEKAGLGFIGKNTMLIDPKAGSYVFLGEIYLNQKLPLTPLPRVINHCGRCTRCIDICPTQAIIAPYQLDARKCISYLTIEHFGAFPIHYRKAIGNRIFGCDDCQLVCPWNRFATPLTETDFLPRHNLDHATLLELFKWDEAAFLKKTEGSAIRRLGHTRWLRNIAIGLGNSTFSEEVKTTLSSKCHHDNEAVRDHVKWALEELSKNPH